MSRTSRASPPTIPDVAAAAGVSRATAARALGGYGSVSPAARSRILEAARRVGYSPNGVARSMITGRTMTLGVVLGDIENEFFSGVARGFTDVARAENFETIVANTDERLDHERAAVRVLLERRVDGLVVSPSSMTDVQHLRAARRAGARLLLLDRRVPGLGVDTVLIDNARAARQLVDRLITSGHRRVGLVTGGGVDGVEDGSPSGSPVSTSLDRLAGYRSALEEAGLPFRPEYVTAGDFHLDSARARTRALLQAATPPTAIFATDSTLALGVMLGIRDLGLSCPNDISVAAFDDPDWASVIRPRLSVMAQPVYDLGAVAARRLIARVRGEVAKPKKHVLTAVWRERESIGPPPRGRRSRPRDQRKVGRAEN